MRMFDPRGALSTQLAIAVCTFNMPSPVNTSAADIFGFKYVRFPCEPEAFACVVLEKETLECTGVEPWWPGAGADMEVIADFDVLGCP